MIQYMNGISPNGYTWVNEYIREKPRSIEPDKCVYFPEANTEALHIKFARLDGSYETFLQFANNYGPLNMLLPNLPEIHEKYPYEDKEEASYYFWKDQCYWVKFTRDIFLATKDNITTLKSKLKPLMRICETELKAPFKKTIIDLGSSTQLLDTIPRIRNKHSTLIISLLDNRSQYIDLHYITAKKLPKSVTTHDIFYVLLGSIINKKMGQFKTTITMNYVGKWEMNIYPTSLIAYIWASLAEELSGQKTYKQCRVCGEWEDRSFFNARKDWVEHPSCGARERMKRYREKIKSDK